MWGQIDPASLRGRKEGREGGWERGREGRKKRKGREGKVKCQKDTGSILLTWKCVSALACGNCETEFLISNLFPSWNCPDPWLERDPTLMVDSSLSIPFLNFARNYVPFEKPDIFVFVRGGRFFSLFFPPATLGDSGHICLSVKER